MADPREWGPPMWKIYHTIAENLGKSKKELADSPKRSTSTPRSRGIRTGCSSPPRPRSAAASPLLR